MNAAATSPGPLGLRSTVFLLLRATRKRAAGRQTRQQELVRHRAGERSINWGNAGFVLAVISMMFLNMGSAFVVYVAVTSGERIQAESNGKVVVDKWFQESVDRLRDTTSDNWLRTSAADQTLVSDYITEAGIISREYGGTEASVEKKLRNAAPSSTPSSNAAVAAEIEEPLSSSTIG